MKHCALLYNTVQARKALKALKGLVKLQAIVRGRAVRRQAIVTLNRLQSIVNIQSQFCTNRSQMTEKTQDIKVLLIFPLCLIP